MTEQNAESGYTPGKYYPEQAIVASAMGQIVIILPYQRADDPAYSLQQKLIWITPQGFDARLVCGVTHEAMLSRTAPASHALNLSTPSRMAFSLGNINSVGTQTIESRSCVTNIYAAPNGDWSWSSGIQITNEIKSVILPDCASHTALSNSLINARSRHHDETFAVTPFPIDPIQAYLPIDAAELNNIKEQMVEGRRIPASWLAAPAFEIRSFDQDGVKYARLTESGLPDGEFQSIPDSGIHVGAVQGRHNFDFEAKVNHRPSFVVFGEFKYFNTINWHFNNLRKIEK